MNPRPDENASASTTKRVIAALDRHDPNKPAGNQPKAPPPTHDEYLVFTLPYLIIFWQLFHAPFSFQIAPGRPWLKLRNLEIWLPNLLPSVCISWSFFLFGHVPAHRSPERYSLVNKGAGAIPGPSELGLPYASAPCEEKKRRF